MASDPPSNTQHRRIELQSPLDLSYLVNNARAAARAKIDLHLPSQTNFQRDDTDPSRRNDGLRTAVESGVDKYLEQTFQMAQLGVNVNGIEGERIDWGEGLAGPEEFEPYDHELAKRITVLHGTIEQLNLQLATTRRDIVARAAKEFESQFASGAGALNGLLKRQEEVAKSARGETQDEPSLVIGLEQTSRIWDDTIAELRGLDAKFGESRAKVEAAEKAMAYIEGR